MLFIAEGTVRNYLSEAIAKLNASNRIDAARIAKQKVGYSQPFKTLIIINAINALELTRCEIVSVDNKIQLHRVLTIDDFKQHQIIFGIAA